MVKEGETVTQSQHVYGSTGEKDFETVDEMNAFYARIGCEFKTEDFMLACAHLSKGIVYS